MAKTEEEDIKFEREGRGRVQRGKEAVGVMYMVLLCGILKVIKNEKVYTLEMLYRS